jgi:hypothetical protein
LDGGASWSFSNTGLTNPYVWSLVIDAQGRLFAGTEQGVFWSLDGGASWSNVGLTDFTVYALALEGREQVVAGTLNGGVFWSRIPPGQQPTSVDAVLSEEILTVTVPTRIPTEYTLFQNVPNPFNAETTLHYELPAMAHSRLVIYDLSGQTICTLVRKHQQAGRYTVVWDGRDEAE